MSDAVVPTSLEVLLLEAVTRKDSREVGVLIGLGANVNHAQPDGTTALHLAAKNGDTATLDILLAQPNIKIDARDEDETTPLMEAARAGQVAAIERLTAQGADKEAVDKNFRTPLMLASHANKPEAIRLLIRRGANPNAQTKDGGYTALHFATSRSHYAAVVALAEGGADATIANNAGVTPLDLAQRFNQSDEATRAMTHFIAAAGVGKYLSQGAERSVKAPLTARFKKPTP